MSPAETALHLAAPTDSSPVDAKLIATLTALERKVLWLSAWTIHNANNLRPKRDGLKVGGHQASSASLVTLMTALYFHVLRPEDRIAVKPHASPVFHAIQYLLGHQTREKLVNFRGLGGAQSYPSRTKDVDDVDLSTGSVGLGVAATLFASMVQDYVQLKGMRGAEAKPGRMVALVGDAEFDEGNIFEAMLEGWKHDVRNIWWIIDYNRQSLDSVVSDRLFQRIIGVFSSLGWRVITLKYGKLLHAAFSGPDGKKLEEWIDDCPNSLYSALTYKRAWRANLEKDLGHVPGIRALLASHDDEALHRLMTNLAGHDMAAVLEAFRDGETSDLPTCFIAYTIKGHGLPFAGHKDNHAGLMNNDQIARLRDAHGIAPGAEWEPLSGIDMPAPELAAFLERTPFAAVFPRRHHTQRVPVPVSLDVPRAATMSTQEGFGRILYELAGGETMLARHIVTTSPDVTVSTNLGGWVNRRGLFDRRDQRDIFKDEKIVSAQLWQMGHGGQHIELGIAEHNLFLLLGALGLSGDLFGARLLPVGTVYDPFIARGLDALNYGCYQDSRFMIVATPSGLTLAPEGGAHQSIAQPLIGMGQPGLVYFEPAHVDEVAEIMRWSFEHMQADDGSSVYLRLSTRPIAQPERALSEASRSEIIAGGYWLVAPEPGCEIAVVAMGALVPEAQAAVAALREDIPGAGLLAITSPDRLHADWRLRGAQSHISGLLRPLPQHARLVTVLDGHPATLSWIGSVRGDLVEPLGVERFGQSGDLPDLYRVYGLDADAIVTAAARLFLR